MASFVPPLFYPGIDEAFAKDRLERKMFPVLSLGLGLAEITGITTIADAQKTLATGPDFGRVVAARRSTTSMAETLLSPTLSGRFGA